MMGANHIRVRCYDGVTRMGRIKGKIKKRVWIREGDILIVTPWSFQDEKCDIIYRYLPPQADWLRKNRYLIKKIFFYHAVQVMHVFCSRFFLFLDAGTACESLG